METSLKIYMVGWIMLCLAALLIFVRKPGAFVIGQHRYWHFLTEPWKVLTFLAATTLITVVAPYTGDPTWDYVDGLFMSIFCYATAPWVVATLFYAAKGKSRLAEIFVAIIAWLFSASWSYDGYLLWRDGMYPLTWFANLGASSVIYLCAGMFWNLEWQPGRGVIFAFMQENWPQRSGTFAPWRLAVYGIILALPVIWAVLMFLL